MMSLPKLDLRTGQYIYGNCFMQGYNEFIRESVVSVAKKYGLVEKDLLISMTPGAPPPVGIPTPIVLSVTSLFEDKINIETLANDIHYHIKHLRNPCSGDTDAPRALI